jgi:exonuclease I
MHFKARNYPKSLTQDEQEDWFEVVQSRMQAQRNIIPEYQINSKMTLQGLL